MVTWVLGTESKNKKIKNAVKSKVLPGIKKKETSGNQNQEKPTQENPFGVNFFKIKIFF